MKTRRWEWAMFFLTVGVIAGGIYYLIPVIQESNIEKATVIDASKFDSMKDLDIEIMDTASFMDNDLEKWFKEKQESKGEHIYYDNSHTYMLVIGTAKSSESIWLDGVRAIGSTLVVGYEFKDGADYGIEKDANVTPVLMLRTEGKFEKVAGVAIQQKESEAKLPEIIDEVYEGEAIDTDEKEVEKESDKKD